MLPVRDSMIISTVQFREPSFQSVTCCSLEAIRELKEEQWLRAMVWIFVNLILLCLPHFSGRIPTEVSSGLARKLTAENKKEVAH